MNDDQRDEILTSTHGLVKELAANSKNQEKRLDGYGKAIRQNRDDIDKAAVYQGKCQTRWKMVGYILVPIFGALVGALVYSLFGVTGS